MKIATFALTFSLLSFGLSVNLEAQEFSVEQRLSLEPGQQVSLRMERGEDALVGWRVSYATLPEYEQLKDCPEEGCAVLGSRNGESALEAAFGGFKKFPGEEELFLRNLAPFPLPVEVLLEK